MSIAQDSHNLFYPLEYVTNVITYYALALILYVRIKHIKCNFFLINNYWVFQHFEMKIRATNLQISSCTI